MRRTAFGSYRQIARQWSLTTRASPSLRALSATHTGTRYVARGFSSSSLRAFKHSAVPDASNIDPKSLNDPSDASHKLFSDIAFAFDIDGVLYRGRERIDGAEKVIRMMRSNGMRYVFLTNGGGVSEDKKAASLQERLQFATHDDVVRGRMILSHTPKSAWDDSVKKSGTVFITGSHPEESRQIAEQYGFERVVTPADVLAACRDVYPFDIAKDGLHGTYKPLPDGKQIRKLDDPYSKNIPKDQLKIDYIFIWNDPRDWSVDTQLIYDMLISHQGYFGTISDKNGDASLPNNGWQQDGQPAIWISNLDLLWKTNYPVNRFGTGAFLEALKGVWSASTGGIGLEHNALGKPTNYAYKYAHQKLLGYYDEMVSARAEENKARNAYPLKRVYMIGDNPESDIRGAAEFEPEDGTEWVPILVRTGVWKQTNTEMEPKYKPAVIVDDVVDAVVWALNNEGMKATREWILSPLASTKGYIKLPEVIGQGEKHSVKGVVHPSATEAAAATL